MSTVEASSTVYTMDSLTHELASPLVDKVGADAQYQSLDQHAPMTAVSPRISSTPPSTPGLDHIQGKNVKEDDGNDTYDYGYNDYDDYLDDEYSEPEEDYFFKDFAETDTNESNTTRGPKSKRHSRRHRSQKAMSRFDLQAFARQLHANRLSVLQTRQSKMILTEEDEKELDKLLARKHSLEDAPPVPSLPLDLPKINMSPSPSTTTTEQADSQHNDKVATTNDDTSSELAGPIPCLSASSDSIKKHSILLQKLNDQDRPVEISNDASMDQPLSPSLSDPISLASPKLPDSVSPSESTSSSSNSSTSISDVKNTGVIVAPLATSTSTTIKKKPSWIASHLKHSTSKTKHQLSDTPSPKSPRRSMSVDTLRDRAQQNDSTSQPSTKSTTPPVDQNRKPKLRLFGSLRQSSRSSRASGEGTFRGLMRNLSTVGHRQQQPEQDMSSTTNHSASTMSQAAMAVIHHDASVKKEKLASKKEKATAPELSTKIEVDFMDGVDDTTEQVTHTATSTTGGVRLLTNLLAKARSARRSPKKTSPKQTQQQQEDNDDTTPNERNKVIRRTIIYVQPDALDFMKDGHLPPIPAPKTRPPKTTDDDEDSDDVRFSHDTMMDDASTATTTVEYATATKITRQASRRKRLVENPTVTLPTSNPDNNKKWHLESVSQLNLDKSNDNTDDGQLEGLELREMSDGSVVWGIVKKQGNRKSFFASKIGNTTDQEKQHQPQDDIEKSVLALMGLGPESLDHFSQQQHQQQRAGPKKSKKTPPPIPKRSPRRLADDPQHPGDARRLQRGLSVEEQLDEMMLSIKQAQI